MVNPSERRSLSIGLWAPLPPPLGGIGRWTLRYQAAAPSHGIRVAVANISPPAGAFTERSAFRLDRVRPAVGALSDLARILVAEHPDVCHLTTSLFWATPRDAVALALCRAARVPTVLHIRGSNQMIEWREGLDSARRRALDGVLRKASVVLVLSRELQVYLRSELPGLRVERIGNMVDLQEIDARAAPLLLPPRQRTRILFVGAHTPLKGLTELAQAVLGLPECDLVLVGGEGGAIDPGQRVAMNAALDRLRATGRLTECGELQPDDVTRIYREADIFALPTWREGLPNVLLEAMASGLPCVVTPVGAIPDVIAGGRALEVPVGDAAALQAALARLNGDPALRRSLGEKGKQAVLAEYSVPSVMEQYRALYETLLPG